MHSDGVLNDLELQRNRSKQYIVSMHCGDFGNDFELQKYFW